MTVRIALLVAVLSAITTSSAFCQYYYSSGRQIPLSVDSSKIVVKIANGMDPMGGIELLESIPRIEELMDNGLAPEQFIVCSLNVSNDYDDFLDSLQDLTDIDLTEPYYLLGELSPMVAGEDFCVAFIASMSENDIVTLNNQYGVVIKRPMAGMNNVYILKNTPASGYRMLDVANLYYTLPQTRWAHPDFHSEVYRFGYMLYDRFHEYQPHIKKIIGDFNNVTVWDFADATRPVKVAVVDDGIDGHDDLPYSRLLLLEGYDFCEDQDCGMPTEYSYHGMGCAGIIGASHTTDSTQGYQITTGLISMNPNVHIFSVKIFCNETNPDSMTWASLIADGISYAWNNDAEVISCSWGWRDDSTNFDVINEAIHDAHTLGREGKGCPIFFAAGNWAWYNAFKDVSYPGHLTDCFAVGALQLNDSCWTYSQYGDSLDIMAPSDDGGTTPVWTLDQMNGMGINPGYIPGQYDNCPSGEENVDDINCHFWGTSAACPMVAGTATLLLARDSTLTADTIYHILRQSAVTELEWGTVIPQDTSYGWGRVDAFRAMLAITRGDANNDGAVNVGDAYYMTNFVFKGGPAPLPDTLTGDANCDGESNVGDVSFIINYVFKSGPAPGICTEY